MDVEQAFREWCAVLDCTPTSPGCAGDYRLVRADGLVRLKAVREDGTAEVLAPAMTEAAFCDAVQLVRSTIRLKTVQVARSAARRMSTRSRK